MSAAPITRVMSYEVDPGEDMKSTYVDLTGDVLDAVRQQGSASAEIYIRLDADDRHDVVVVECRSGFGDQRLREALEVLQRAVDA